MNFRSILLLLVAATLALPGSAWAQSVLPDDFELEEPEEEEEEEPEDEDEDEVEEEPEPEEEPVRSKKKTKTRRKIKDRRQTSGLGFTLSVGGLTTFRRMKFSGTDATIRHTPDLYFGGIISASMLVLTVDSSKAHLLIEGEGGYGAAKNADVEPALGRPLTTEHAYLLLLAMYEQPLVENVDLRLGLGFSALSYTVEPNPQYTGHRYLSVAASFGANYWLSKKVYAGGSLTFFPGVSTNQSAGDYGTAQSFGGRGEAHINWRFIQPEPPDLFGSAQVGARYSYTRFQTTLPETQVLGDLAGTGDSAHTLTLTLSYNL